MLKESGSLYKTKDCTCSTLNSVALYAGTGGEGECGEGEAGEGGPHPTLQHHNGVTLAVPTIKTFQHIM